jgi:hypothetical protein
MAWSNKDYIAVIRGAFANCAVNCGGWLFRIGCRVVVACRICATIYVVDVAGGKQRASDAAQSFDRYATGFHARWKIGRHRQFLLVLRNQRMTGAFACMGHPPVLPIQV